MVQLSTAELVFGLTVILGFQFTIIKMLGGHIVKTAAERLEAVEEGLDTVKDDLKNESQKTRNRIHGLELALERNGMRVRMAISDDGEELDG